MKKGKHRMGIISKIHESDLFSFTYISHCIVPNSSLKHELANIQKVASERNAAVQVSGKLIYRRDFFLQRLEGPKLALNQILESISIDTRHRNIEVLFFDKISRRIFPDWSQIQVIIESNLFSELDSFLVQSSLVPEHSLNDCQSMSLLKFMQQFKDHES